MFKSILLKVAGWNILRAAACAKMREIVYTRAGMAVIAVTNTHPAESLKQADFIVDSLEKVSTAIIDKLINKNRRG